MNFRTLLIAAVAIIGFSAPAFAHHGDQGNNGSSSSATAISQSGASNSNRNIERHQAPGFGVGGLASDECHGSWTAAISTPWGGLGGGRTTGDDDCRQVYIFKVLKQSGYGKQAVQYLVNENPAVRRAFFPTAK